MVLISEYKKAKEQHKKRNMRRRSYLNLAMNVIKEFEHPSIQGKTMYSSVLGGSNEGGKWRSIDSAANTDGPTTMSDLHAFIEAFISSKKAGTHSLDSKPIIIDSGESHHMISDRNLISDVQSASGNVLIANGDKVKIKGIGNLRLFDRESTALYMPQFTSNLLSVRKATVDLSFQVVFRPDGIKFQDLKTGHVIGKRHIHNELYHLQKTGVSGPSTSRFLAITSSGVDSTLWHARLEYPHTKSINLMLPENHKYFITFVDEKSKYTWVTLIQSKDRVLDAFKNFYTHICNHFNVKLKIPKTPTKVPNDLSLFEVLNKTKPSLDHLRVFGCLYFMLILGEQRRKLDAKSSKAMFIGISQPQTSGVPRTSPTPPVVDEVAPSVEIVNHDPEGAATQDQDGAESDQSSEDQCSGEQGQEDAVVEEQQIQSLRRSTRVKKPSKWVDTRVYFNSNAVAHPIQTTCSLASYPQEHVVFTSNLDQEYIPKTFEEVMELDEWRDSVRDEINVMIKNDTWYETELPKGKKTVTSRLLFTIKYLANGKPEKKKTRLVPRGYIQVYGENYLDSFAPVGKLHTIRILLSLAVNLEWDLLQMDVKNDFLQGELEDEVYMRLPPGMEDFVKPGNVLR
ncbi:PREDICTED: uncharacterized protein LOC106314595 [Brassica oleracea var. oleracea]|uniref:uncharacterized protein LOC106314595 n=1 Tax=Brassica oleracea var. oleracea TaxID=109376 RepID=UPI0006A749FD|nr:PREDICTED: uncharacterized protein LOC106314595 [Brassica oleracea var. oleracea]